MLHTVADEIWGQPCLAYHVQPGLQPHTHSELARLQGVFSRLWPTPLHLCPTGSLHVTIYALAGVKDRYDKDAYWRTIAEPCRALVAELCAGERAFSLHFSRLKVTDAAIIAVARDETGLIERIRTRIADVLPPPPGLAPLRYNLVHSTLARYQTSEPVAQATVDMVESLPVAVDAPVRRIKIISESLFPCQHVREIASFPLG